MQQYGSFEVVQNEDVQQLKKLLEKMKLPVYFVLHHCDTDEEYDCNVIPNGDEV